MRIWSLVCGPLFTKKIRNLPITYDNMVRNTGKCPVIGWMVLLSNVRKGRY